MGLEVFAFVVRVPAETVYVRVAVNHGYPDLGAELGLCGKLPTHDRPHVRLEDAHNPLGTLMNSLAEHFLLLPEHFYRGAGCLEVGFAEYRTQGAPVLAYAVKEDLEVVFQAADLGQLGAFLQCAPLELLLDALQERNPCHLPLERLALDALVLGQKLVQEPFNQPAAVLEEVQVGGVTHLGGAACGVDFELCRRFGILLGIAVPILLVAVAAVAVFFSFAELLFLVEGKSEAVEEVDAEPLPVGHHQGRV